MRKPLEMMFPDKLVKGTFANAALPDRASQKCPRGIDTILYGLHPITNFHAYIINKISIKVYKSSVFVELL